MPLELSKVNERAKEDARGFIEECEAKYAKSISLAASKIAEKTKESCVVLLSGPSGSGKTTTALKLSRELAKLGIATHPISLDDYFRTVEFETAPKDENGKIDYESPLCLDMPLLNEHIGKIMRHEEVLVPKFDFKNQKRSDITVPLKVGQNEVVIFEGIHALNDEIASAGTAQGIKLYISARSIFKKDGEDFFKGTWTRLVRRIVRDNLFRGANSDFTLAIWDNIRKGEKKYISPFRDRADIIINSTHDYEIGVLKKHLLDAVKGVPEGIARYNEVLELLENIKAFEDIPDELVPTDSLLREFIGGGNFEY